MMMDFASFYDAFMEDIDYDFFVDFVALHLIKTDHILDAGCGSGTLLSMLHDQGYMIEGVDIDESMLSLARKKTLANLYLHDLHEPLLGETYDGILMFFDVLNYSQDPRRIVQNVYDALKPGGKVLFDIHDPRYIAQLDHHIESGQIEDLDYTWSVSVEENVITHDVTLKQGSETRHEAHVQYIIDPHELRNALHDIGFQSIQMDDTDQVKVFFMAQKS